MLPRQSSKAYQRRLKSLIFNIEHHPNREELLKLMEEQVSAETNDYHFNNVFADGQMSGIFR